MLQKCTRTLLFSYVGFFIAIEIALMILVLFSFVDATNFLIQLVVLVGVLIIVLNLWAFVLYCSNAGSPFKNEKNARASAWSTRIAAYWTVAIIGKLIAIWYDPEIFNIEALLAGNNLNEAITFFTIIVLCEMMPIACALEGKFIKIFTLDHLDASKATANPTESVTDSLLDDSNLDADRNQHEEELRLLDPEE